MHFYEKESVSLYLDELEILEDIITEKQRVKIYRHPLLGLILTINNEIQHIEKYQCLYHELLVHLPISFCAEPQTALIIGGGSLFAAYEILKYPSIKKVVLCDHDHLVLDLMGKYYSHAKIVRKDFRFRFIEHDGIAYIQNASEKYDVIINDCFNLLSESKKNDFSLYQKMNNMLTAEGVCADIIYRHIFDGNITHDSIQKIKGVGNIALSLVAVPEYPGILHIETIWGKNSNISQYCKATNNLFQKECIAKENTPFYFFSPENIPFYLYLPPYIKNFIK
jgi:spermidine synthase